MTKKAQIMKLALIVQKTLWKKEKMQVTSIFFFSHNVFYPSQNKFQFFSKIYLSSANAFNSDQSKNLSLGKRVNICLANAFNLDQTKTLLFGKESKLGQKFLCFTIFA